jgi:hypothetical protein
MVTIPGNFGTVEGVQRPIAITVPEDLAPEDVLEVFNFVYQAMFGLRKAQEQRAKSRIVIGTHVPPIARG